jgi:hypothetical protein
MKRGLLIFAVFACSIIPDANAQLGPDAFQIILNVTNSSTKCVWVTPYWSRPLFPWAAAFIPEAANWLRPGRSRMYTVVLVDAMGTQALQYEVKVRAEFMTDVNCNHPVVGDRSGQNNQIFRIKRGENNGLPRKYIRMRSSVYCHGNDCSVSRPEEE